MDIGRAHFEFQLRLNKIHTSGNPNFFDYQIDAYFDRAQLELLGGYYTHGREPGSGFETSHQAIAALSNLLVKSPGLQSVLTPTEYSTGLFEVNLGDLAYDIVFPVKVEITAKKEKCTKRLTYNLWQHDDVKNRINQPSWMYGRVHGNFAKSNSGTSLPRFTSLYLDATNVKNQKEYDITQVFVSYLKRPVTPWLGTYDLTTDLKAPTGTNTVYTVGDPPVSFELEEFFHNQIVNIAVDLAVNDLRKMTASNS